MTASRPEGGNRTEGECETFGRRGRFLRIVDLQAYRRKLRCPIVSLISPSQTVDVPAVESADVHSESGFLKVSVIVPPLHFDGAYRSEARRARSACQKALLYDRLLVSYRIIFPTGIVYVGVVIVHLGIGFPSVPPRVHRSEYGGAIVILEIAVT